MKIIKFYADWCGPCKTVAPVIEQVATERQLELVNVNMDERPEMLEQYGVRSIPTIVVERDGKEIKRFHGVTTKEKFDIGFDLLAQAS